jgi:hypothetical protein
VGGVGIGGHTRLSPAAYSASFLACLPHLVTAGSVFATLDSLTTNLPMVADCSGRLTRVFKRRGIALRTSMPTCATQSCFSPSIRPRRTSAFTPSH